ncbi:MAG: ATP-binding protein [Sulfuricurvum sp.]|uniref:ATP-binding protein n=1 Tax=Sulfuricurvum sp. TaxID=2025608 RepID=UPI0027346941|nr:ATP-binding protein [Sulfuricurvum sp.]MDP2850803.1 ATP-binding protein [Sulfuricurvum sp.]
MAHLNLKNFAKIKDSDFDIQDITVFTGKPGSGKSYIMKLLYAFDESFHKTKSEYKVGLEVAKEVLSDYDKFKKNVMPNLSKEKIDEILFHLKNYRDINEKISQKEKDIEELVKFSYKNILESIFGNLNQISNKFEITSDFFNLKYDENNLSIDVITSKQDDWEVPDNVLFVETPLILEFKKFMIRDKGKTPYHIESLLKILDKDYSFTDEEQDEFIKSFIIKSKAIIKGNIEDSGDSFIFKSNDKIFDIVNASSGIKSIGLLQYLVTNKALKKGSTLFWEEPEVHLHPTWQLKMVELFIELMNAGVKIVFSTHSPYMADYLNALAKNKGIRDRVSFNLLNEVDGVVSNTILNEENWQNLQKELLGPLEDVMWQYL